MSSENWTVRKILTWTTQHFEKRGIDAPRLTTEVLLVRSGRVRLDFYDDARAYLESTVLEAGDVVLLARGGHGLEMLEASELIEVKQGPYAGGRDKVRFDPVDPARIVWRQAP